MKKSNPSSSPKTPARTKRNDSIIEARPGKAREVRMDGWKNILTNVGIKGKDKRLSSSIQWNRLEEIDAEHAYAGDKMARKIVDLPIEEALKKGWNVKLDDPEMVKKVNERAQELDLFNEFPHACKMARLYGGAGMIINNGDAKLETPMAQVRKLISLTTLNRWELYAQWEDVQKNILQPHYGKPKQYTLQPRGVTTEHLQAKIHTSRVVRFDGEWLPQYLFRENQYWGDSILNGLLDAIRDYQLSNDSVSLMVQDFCVAVFKIKGLADQIASDGDEAVIARMQIADLTRSIARAIVIDADGEEFDHKTRPVTGIKDLMDKVEGRLVSQTNFPHTVLFGNSPSGMGGTGNHEQSNWYDFLEAWQENYAKPRLMEIYEHICDELSIDKKSLEIEFPPLFSANEKEMAEVRQIMANTDNIYHQIGALSSEEIAKNRFMGEKYSIETRIETLPTEPINGGEV